jgi:hypothetical protein
MNRFRQQQLDALNQIFSVCLALLMVGVTLPFQELAIRSVIEGRSIPENLDLISHTYNRIQAGIEILQHPIETTPSNPLLAVGHWYALFFGYCYVFLLALATCSLTLGILLTLLTITLENRRTPKPCRGCQNYDGGYYGKIS